MASPQASTLAASPPSVGLPPPVFSPSPPPVLSPPPQPPLPLDSSLNLLWHDLERVWDELNHQFTRQQLILGLGVVFGGPCLIYVLVKLYQWLVMWCQQQSDLSRLNSMAG